MFQAPKERVQNISKWYDGSMNSGPLLLHWKDSSDILDAGLWSREWKEGKSCVYDLSGIMEASLELVGEEMACFMSSADT